jgi:hypothetical protein
MDRADPDRYRSAVEPVADAVEVERDPSGETVSKVRGASTGPEKRSWISTRFSGCAVN